MKKVFAVLLAAAFLVGCGKKDGGKVVLRVGDDKMTIGTVEKRFKDAPYALQGYLSTESGKKQFVDILTRERIVVESAKQAGYEKRKDYKEAVKNYKQEQEKQYKDYLENVLVELYVKDLQKDKLSVAPEEISKYYDDHKDEYKRPLEIKARHILVPSKEEAGQVLERLKKGADFAKLAKEVSVDPISAQRGGEIGPFSKGDLVPEFEKAVFPLKPGKISDIVETQFGYHIITKVSEKVLPARSMEDAAPEIKRVLEKGKFDAWLEVAKQKCGVTVDYKALESLNPSAPQLSAKEEAVKPATGN